MLYAVKSSENAANDIQCSYVDIQIREVILMTKSIAIRIDEELKQQAETTLDEIGLNMTTYVISSLKALVREQGVPFELTTKQRKNEQYLSKLDDALDDLQSNGGFEYLGKDESGKAKFGNTPVKASL